MPCCSGTSSAPAGLMGECDGHPWAVQHVGAEDGRSELGASTHGCCSCAALLLPNHLNHLSAPTLVPSNSPQPLCRYTSTPMPTLMPSNTQLSPPCKLYSNTDAIQHTTQSPLHRYPNTNAIQLTCHPLEGLHRNGNQQQPAHAWQEAARPASPEWLTGCCCLHGRAVMRPLLMKL